MKLSEMKRKRFDVDVPGFPKPVRVEFTFRGIEFLQDFLPGATLLAGILAGFKSNEIAKMRISWALVFASLFDEVAAPGDLGARFEAFKADPRWTVDTLGLLVDSAFGTFLSFMAIDLKEKDETENPPGPAEVEASAGTALSIPSTTPPA